ncbi:MAG: PASTA domain-containing protein [Defluviitaleaceae bacterium]|nr:PASTA domain-containing protein [Defluviitaleaceae bacterium]
MKFCSNCNLQYDEAKKFCQKCGEALVEAVSDVMPTDAPQVTEQEMQQEETLSDISFEMPVSAVSAAKSEDPSLYLAEGTVLLDNYVVGGVIGFGGFGATYLCYSREGDKQFALKEYLPAEFSTRVPGQAQITVFSDTKKQKQFHDGLVKFIEEGKRISALRGEGGLVQIFDVFEANNTAYIVMEHIKGGLLEHRLTDGHANIKFEPAAAIDFMLPLIRSLQTPHSAGIFHLDIAPSNVFVTNDGRAKLIDFAAYRHVTTSHSRSLSVVVKQGFSPEELYRSSGDLGAHTDVYGLGALLYHMLTGVVPPDAMERRMQLENGKKDPLKPIKLYSKGVSKGQENAIMNALNVRIEDRTPDVATFANELEDSATKRRGQKVSVFDIGKWPKWAKGAVAAAALSITTTVTLLAFGVFGFATPDIVPEGMARVPSLINLALSDARTRVEESNLQYLIVGREFSLIIPADFVLDQDLAAGSVVETNSMVAITVSGGAEMGLVPDVVGTDADEAQQELENLGFTVRRLYDYSRFIVAGNVAIQNIEGGSAHPLGVEIRLTISRGPDPDSPDPFMSDVPDVVGMMFEDAMAASYAAGFAIEVIERRYGSELAGTVLSQSLIPGTREMTDNPMSVVVSSGVQMALVPNVQFRSQAEAEQALRALGFSVSVTTATDESVISGNVISQSPAADTQQVHGTDIAIVISTGGAPISLPQLTGTSEAEARARLGELGLMVTVSFETSTTVAKGNVIRQNPTAGTMVTRGQSVSIVVSAGGEVTFTVPNTVGMSQADAENALGSNLRSNISMAYHDSVPEGNVISQSPAAGTEVLANHVVNLVVSSGREPITITNHQGGTLASAQAWAATHGFNLSITREHSDIEANQIISQTPNSGTAFRGDTITLVVSDGPSDVVVPNVIGQTRTNAENTLRGLGLTVEITEASSTTVAANNIISQSPSAGTRWPGDAPVILTVSTGPPPSHTITYNANGGTGNMAAITVVQGQNHVVLANNFNRTGFVFTGWNTQAQGNGTSFVAGAVISNVQANITLYAQWGTQEVPVTNITNVPTTALVGTSIALTGTVVPANATHQTIVWSVTNPGTTGATVSGNTLTTPNAGTVTVRATIAGGAGNGVAYTQDFNIVVGIVGVSNITDIPTTASTGTVVLGGTVMPVNATNRNITWSVQSAGTTGATISGNVLSVPNAGTVTVRATIVNGLPTGNFTQDFSIVVTAPHIPVTNITGVPTTATVGVPLSLSGSTVPMNATNQAITWSVQSAGGTGASISGSTLNTTSAGTVTVRATITNGVSITPPQNFIQDFSINVANVPVTGIPTVSSSKTAGTPITLPSLALPDNATNRTIVWSVQNAGATGATISGNTLNTNVGTSGSITVLATVINGLGQGSNFTQTANISVISGCTHATAISHNVPSTMQTGATHTITANVSTPSNATAHAITWTATGAATVSGNVITAGSTAGTATLTATVTCTSCNTVVFTNAPISITIAPSFVPATAISQNIPSNMTVGATHSIVTSVSAPSNATAHTITWSATGAATVSGTTITATTAGTATLTATLMCNIRNVEVVISNRIFTINIAAACTDPTGLSGVPNSMEAGTPLALTGTVTPATANANVTWSVSNPGTTGAWISGSTLNATSAGTVAVMATVVCNICGHTVTPTFNITVTAPPPSHIPVTGITGVPTNATAGVPLGLWGTVMPANATNQTITWSVQSAGTTGASISGSMLNTTSAGTVTVRATITNGSSPSAAFTQDFTINVD